jgi:hypothetical protein
MERHLLDRDLVWLTKVRPKISLEKRLHRNAIDAVSAVQITRWA